MSTGYRVHGPACCTPRPHLPRLLCPCSGPLTKGGVGRSLFVKSPRLLSCLHVPPNPPAEAPPPVSPGSQLPEDLQTSLFCLGTGPSSLCCVPTFPTPLLVTRADREANTSMYMSVHFVLNEETQSSIEMSPWALKPYNQDLPIPLGFLNDFQSARGTNLWRRRRGGVMKHLSDTPCPRPRSLAFCLSLTHPDQGLRVRWLTNTC